ncbi:MAG: hypothetical protein FJW39_11560 [Acidobacteria bacterium]|nr:hypothetical protein [Acidobacteriota bacterium]
MDSGPPARPIFNTISVLLPCLILLLTRWTLNQDSPRTGIASAMAGGIVMLIGACLASAAGFIAAVIALIRGERWIGVSLLGLLASVGIAVWVVSWFKGDGSR